MWCFLFLISGFGVADLLNFADCLVVWIQSVVWLGLLGGYLLLLVRVGIIQGSWVLGILCVVLLTVVPDVLGFVLLVST